MYIRSHHDADGISSLVLYLKANNIDISDVNIEFPKVFGEFNDKTNIMLDMTPFNSDYTGLCIDHHDQHPEEHKYSLIFDRIGATALLIFNNFDIPDEELWKVAVGCIGDVCPEQIPYKVWKKSPELMDLYSSVWIDYNNKGGVNLSGRHSFRLISSPINSASRIGKVDEAFQILYFAESIDDIIYNDTLSKYKTMVRKEVERVFKKAGYGNRLPEIIGNFVVFEYDSNYRISGIVGAKLHEFFEEKKTIIAINRQRDGGSARGVLCNYLKTEMINSGFNAGGHSGAMGVSLNGKSISELKELLREI